MCTKYHTLYCVYLIVQHITLRPIVLFLQFDFFDSVPYVLPSPVLPGFGKLCVRKGDSSDVFCLPCIPSRRPGTRLCARTSNVPASGGDSTTVCGMHRSRISCACLSGSAQWLCRTAGRTDAPRHPEISVRFVPSCFPLMLHLAAKPLCFLRKAGKNALKMTGVSRITFIGRICYENNPPFVGFFCHCKQNHMEYLQFQKE